MVGADPICVTVRARLNRSSCPWERCQIEKKYYIGGRRFETKEWRIPAKPWRWISNVISLDGFTVGGKFFRFIFAMMAIWKLSSSEMEDLRWSSLSAGVVFLIRKLSTNHQYSFQSQLKMEERIFSNNSLNKWYRRRAETNQFGYKHRNWTASSNTIASMLLPGAFLNIIWKRKRFQVNLQNDLERCCLTIETCISA